MVYVLMLNDKVYGVYDTLDLVRLNMMILLFHNMELGRIGVNRYQTLVDYLRSPSFSEETFNIPEFKKNVKGCGIKLSSYKEEKNGSCPLKYIMNHINWRFLNLRKKMEHDSRVKITIPGDNRENHQLGTPYQEDWKLVDKDNWETLYYTLHEYLSKKIGELEKKFPSRVKFGEVLYENATETDYQLWSANAVNWNLPEGEEIPGKYQAQEMKFQGPGVFGIVVTPLYGYQELVPNDYEMEN